MDFFLLLIIPAAIFCLISTDSKYSFKQLSVPVFSGFFAGIICSVFIEFFIYPEKSSGSSFFSILVPALSDTFFPSIILTALFFFFSKDSIEYKTYSILPLLGMFYAIFIPYKTLTQGETNSLFLIFINPVLFIETIFLFSGAFNLAGSGLTEKNRKKLLTAVLGIILILLLQPVLYSMWYLNILLPVAIILAILLAPFSVLFYKFSCK